MEIREFIIKKEKKRKIFKRKIYLYFNFIGWFLIVLGIADAYQREVTETNGKSVLYSPRQ